MGGRINNVVGSVTSQHGDVSLVVDCLNAPVFSNIHFGSCPSYVPLNLR